LTPPLQSVSIITAYNRAVNRLIFNCIQAYREQAGCPLQLSSGEISSRKIRGVKKCTFSLPSTKDALSCKMDTMTIPTYPDEMPAITTPQMIEVDRAMIEDFHIELIQMMENAGRNLAHLARVRFFNGNPVGKRVVVLAGTGGNGGGALVCARRLHNWGVQVQIFLTKPAGAFRPVPAHQLDILRRMQVPVAQAEAVINVKEVDLIVDGIIGYSLAAAPQGTAATLIRWANEQDPPILALDTPSGLDPTSGTIFDPAIRATATMTLALPKKGLLAAETTAQVGELYLADISVPPALYAKPALKLEIGPIFAKSDIIRLR
jgi:NAD(P)H-hydrate epimerase